VKYSLELKRKAAVAALFIFALAALGSPGGRGAAAQSAESMLLVLNKSEATLVIIDPASLKVVARVPTGEGPHEVTASADGRLAFVANYGTGPSPGNSISVIDLMERKEVKRVDLGPLLRPHGIREAGGKVYFTVEANRAVARYDPAAGRVDWIMGTGQNGTHMVVISPDSKKLYTPNIGSDTVTMMRLVGQQGQPPVVHIPVGRNPEGIDISPDGRELWVGHNGDGMLSIIDTATDKVKETIKVGRTPIRVKFTPDGKRVLVSDAPANEVAVFDAATRKEVKRIPVGAVPVGILVTPDGRRAFVAATQANKVSVINLEDLTMAATIEPGREPDGMAWVGR
jgi:YVTN family beta-propeller protein